MVEDHCRTLASEGFQQLVVSLFLESSFLSRWGMRMRRQRESRALQPMDVWVEAERMDLD